MINTVTLKITFSVFGLPMAQSCPTFYISTRTTRCCVACKLLIVTCDFSFSYYTLQELIYINYKFRIYSEFIFESKSLSHFLFDALCVFTFWTSFRQRKAVFISEDFERALSSLQTTEDLVFSTDVVEANEVWEMKWESLHGNADVSRAPLNARGINHRYLRTSLPPSASPSRPSVRMQITRKV